MYYFIDSLAINLKDFKFEKLFKTIWWNRFRRIKFSSRVKYGDTLAGYIAEVLHCYDYFINRAFSKVDKNFLKKAESSLLKLWDTTETNDTLTRYEYEKLAKGILWNHLENSLGCLTDFDTIAITFLKDTVSQIYNTSYGKIAIGGTGDDIYEGNLVAIIDFGGNDQYKTDSTVLIVDISGNDVYRGNVAQGFFGASVVMDFSGNDLYMCSNMSCASGIVGFGVIFDGDGDDIYVGGYHSVASGTFGGGFIIDLKGDDVYKSMIYGEGFGGPYGVGLLMDFEGNDTYTLGYGPIHKPLYKTQREGMGQGFGFGLRDGVGGGMGMLLDYGGNDVYNAGTFAQGASYWYAFGGLYDGGGDDRYICTQYCQGTGIHISSGILIDKNGNDIYFALNGPSIGAGHDLSVGIFYDENGNDHYYTYGGLGMGLRNSVGVFVDMEGNDSYATKECEFSFGGANVKREMGGIGMFLDGNGKDTYSCGIENGKIWLKSTWGIGWHK